MTDVISNLRNCIHNCTQCPLYKNLDRPPIAFSGKATIPIMLVTDSPGIEEFYNQEILSSKAGAYLAELFTKVGFDPSGFIRTSAVKCHQLAFEGNTPTQILDCGSWLDEEIKLFQPKVIVAFGNVGVYRFSDNYHTGSYEAKKDGTPKDLKGILDKNGLIHWDEKYNCYVLHLPNPSFILNNKNKEQAFLDSLKRLKELHDNNYVIDNKTEYYSIYPKVGQDRDEFLIYAKSFLKYISQFPEYACDTETTGLDYFNDKILLVTFSWDIGKSATFYWDEELWLDFKTLLENDAVKIFHNAKFDLHMLHEINIFPTNVNFDTMIAASLLDENSPVNLGFCTSRYLGLEGDYKSKFWNGSKSITLNSEEEFIAACQYANTDGDYTFRLKRVLEEELKRLKLLPLDAPDSGIFLYRDISIPLMHTLLELEKTGIFVDLDYQKVLHETLSKNADVTFQKAENLLYDHMYKEPKNTLTALLQLLKIQYDLSIIEIQKFKHLSFSQKFYSEVQEYINQFQNYFNVTHELCISSLSKEDFRYRLSEANKILLLVEEDKQTFLDAVNEVEKPKTRKIKSGLLFNLSSIKSSIKRKKIPASDLAPIENCLVEINNLYENLDNLSGIKMNLNSSDQMSKILYEILGLPVHKWTKNQKPSTDKETIALLANDHEFPNLITKYRNYTHDISNYIEGVNEAIKVDYRIHPDFSQTRTVTGRLSCLRPALHNISGNFSIRNQFIPEKGNLFVECVEENTLVQTNKGLLRIKDIKEGYEVLTHKNRYKEVDRVIDQGLKECYEVVTETGKKVTVTENHPFYVMNSNGFEFKKLCNINVQTDRLVFHDNPVVDCGENDIDEDDAYVIGFLFGDGYYGNTPKRYTKKSNNKEYEYPCYTLNFATGLDCDELYKKLGSYFLKKHNLNIKYRDEDKGDLVVHSKELLLKWITKYPKKGSHSLRVPENIFNQPFSIRKAFLAGVIDSDGSYHSRRMTITSVSECFIDDLLLLCNSIGVHGIKRVNHVKKGYGATPENPIIAYTLDVFEMESLERLPDGWLDRKRESKYKMLDKEFSQCRTARHSVDSLAPYHRPGIQGKKNIPILKVFQNSKRSGFVYRRAISKAISTCYEDAKHFQPLLDYRSQAIVSIAPVGERQTYDLEVDTDSSFTANSVIVHNCDASQAEIRFLAVLSGDKNLKNALESGEDIHTVNARRIFKIPESQKPTKDQRRGAKAVVFGIIYGKEVSTLAVDLQISLQEAQSYFTGFYEAYPDTKKWMDSKIHQAKTEGYVNNLFNRLRRLPNINSSDKREKRESERYSINAPVQSSASDYVGYCQIMLEERFKTKYRNVKVIPKQVHQQHDMVLVEAPISIIKEVKADVQEIMEHALDLGVEIKADADIVCCWSGAPMTDEDVDKYAIDLMMGLVPVYGYCQHGTPIYENDTITGIENKCNKLIKPYSFSKQVCLDHYKEFIELKEKGVYNVIS